MWEIVDDNGCIYSGEQEEMQQIWDIVTRDVNDLACEYRGLWSRKEIFEKKKQLDFSWTGDLKLIEIHNTHR